jgi:hypothetical protein
MRPVWIFSMPHNYRDELYNEGDGPSFVEYEQGEQRRPSPSGRDVANLPIPMPECLLTFTDREGRVISAQADDKRIRWRDLDTVVTGVTQYNADVARREAGEGGQP